VKGGDRRKTYVKQTDPDGLKELKGSPHKVLEPKVLPMEQSFNRSPTWQVLFGLRGFAIAVLLVAASTIVGMLMADKWGNVAVDMVYIPAVLGAAVLSGRWPALVAAVASALAFNFFFTAPYHSFRIHSPSDVVTFVVLLGVALVTSYLVASIRHQADIAEAHASRNATIAGLARNLISCQTPGEVADVACRQLGEIFDCNTVLVSGKPTPVIVSSVPEGNHLTPSDVAAAALVLETGGSAGRGAARVAPAEWQFHEIQTETEVVAAMGLARDDDQPPVSEEKLPLLQSLLDQVALALDRARLEKETLRSASV
jgi:two-component system sensor histidine kinase KdpD